jgi:hypothetical protein
MELFPALVVPAQGRDDVNFVLDSIFKQLAHASAIPRRDRANQLTRHLVIYR